MTESPLLGPPPPEVPLPDAPLVRVVAQVRFPLIASMERREFVGPFQEAIRGEYGVLRQEHTDVVNFHRAEQAQVAIKTSSLWRFRDVDGRWRVTLAGDFLALETRDYTSREDFFTRFGRLLTALEEHVQPAVIDRLGVRYIDRITGAPLENLGGYIRPALLGVLNTALGPRAHISFNESVFDIPEEGGQVRARWGILPPHATIDPHALAPIPEKSWVLDLDAFQSGERLFASAQVAGEARALAERIYTFFRWSVTDDFLAHFGGKP